MSITAHVCIHGHFYQPPRENPFTGVVPDQPSAAPYPNWNVRITEECYEANTHARILGDDGSVVTELNNYEWISFDFGPTLLSWLEDNSPSTYKAIRGADEASRARFGGHGSAMAHSYNHTILPLSDSHDKRTQVIWGIADFRHRFGRDPEGMWLPETAVDRESLQILAEQGIRFTVLSPYQVAAVKAPAGDWIEASNGSVDTRRAYQVELDDGESISVFFYDGPLSQEIAFNGLLEDGKQLAERLVQSVAGEFDGHALATVATDGESYGHHHRFGEMALAAALLELENDPDVRIVNYGQYLAMSPAIWKARVMDETSWSCVHGVERWRNDCGCSTGSHPDATQGWRAPLRAALDTLREELRESFLSVGGELFQDPWRARDAYINVLLGADPSEFLAAEARGELSADDGQRALDLLEIQHRAMLMYTSCGWFFDDIGRIEAVLVLRHAGRAIALARNAFGVDAEPEFLKGLDAAVSGVDGRTGRDVYMAEVAPYLRP